MNLYPRDYLKGLTDSEKSEYKVMLEKEKEGMKGFGCRSLYHQYSLPTRNCLSLFPNNPLAVN